MCRMDRISLRGRMRGWLVLLRLKAGKDECIEMFPHVAFLDAQEREEKSRGGEESNVNGIRQRELEGGKRELICAQIDCLPSASQSFERKILHTLFSLLTY